MEDLGHNYCNNTAAYTFSRGAVPSQTGNISRMTLEQVLILDGFIGSLASCGPPDTRKVGHHACQTGPLSTSYPLTVLPGVTSLAHVFHIDV